MNGKIPAMLSPVYPWGQGEPQRMEDGGAKPATYESPDLPDGGGGIGGALVISAFFVGAALLWDFQRRKGLFRRRRR